MMDEIIENDLNELNQIIAKANESGDTNIFLSVAIKAKDIADLFYEMDNDFNDAFYKYKNMAADYYYKVAKKANFLQAILMGIILYIEANNLKKAEKLLKKIISKKKKQMIDPIILDLVIDILHGNFKEVYNKFKDNDYIIDENIYPEIERMLEYQQIHNSRRSKKEKEAHW